MIYAVVPFVLVKILSRARDHTRADLVVEIVAGINGLPLYLSLSLSLSLLQY